MHLLIDGKNLLYRGIYTSNTQNVDCFVVLSRMMHSYLHRFNPKHIHIFWDDHRDNLWRCELLPDYKLADCRDRAPEIDEQLARYGCVCEEVWANMSMRQYKRDHMEADDLIYAFCAVVNEPTLIISSDGDMTQLAYKFDWVSVYSPTKKILTETTEFDPVVQKCLSGDTSDNISGYYRVGPVTAEKCARDIGAFHKLLKDKGADIYHRNRRLIDLAMCPEATENMTYIIEQLATQQPQFKLKLIVELLYRKHKIRGIMTEFKSIISPFKVIGE